MHMLVLYQFCLPPINISRIPEHRIVLTIFRGEMSNNFIVKKSFQTFSSAFDHSPDHTAVFRAKRSMTTPAVFTTLAIQTTCIIFGIPISLHLSHSRILSLLLFLVHLSSKHVQNAIISSSLTRSLSHSFFVPSFLV